MTSVNIASHLPAMAEKQPHNMAVAIARGPWKKGRPNYEKLSFSELNQESDSLAEGLEKIGITRGCRTVLMVQPSREFFSLTFGLFKVGAVPVLVDPGLGIKNLSQCLKEAQPSAFIGIPKAHGGRILFGWAKSTIKINVTVGKRLFWGGWKLSQIYKLGKSSGSTYKMAPTTKDEMAAILFTSGSTGVPKGAVYSHGNFSAQVEILKRLYGIQPGEIDLATFPLFALFGPALGMAVVSPFMDASKPAQVHPPNILGPMEDFQITNLFGSPALLNKVSRYGEQKKIKLPRLKRVLSAGAPVPAVVLKRFSTMLNPETQIFTPYGATESLPVCSIGSHEILEETSLKTAEGAGVCVGHPVEEIEVAIIKITDQAISTWSNDLRVSPGEIGEIVVQGPQVTREYYNRPESTALAKIATPDHKSFWHRMGDLGYFDDRGRIWFCGRKTHRVITKKETLFTVACEGVFNSHPHVFRTALVGLGTREDQRPILCVELEKGSYNTEKIKGELLELGKAQDHTKNIQTILFHPSFPVDIRHNAKIFREKLALWAEEKIK